jgi:uncharacterized membrane protein SpoIIM required for sporulation
VGEPLSQFVAERGDRWDRLEALTTRARGRVQRLAPAEISELGASYRGAVADLAYARQQYRADPVTRRLEVLVGDARPLVYGSVTERESVARFVTTGFWRRVAERPVYLVVSALLLFVPMGAMGFWSHANPRVAARVAQVSDLSAGVGEGEFRDPDTETITETGTNAGFSAAIFTNNARVALVAFAGGLTGGAMTVVSLLFNGLLVGLIAGLAVAGGNGEAFWRLVVPHGVLEMSLIVVAGAAGLRTGWALVHPGHRTRVEALAVEGRAGVEMALGAAALLVPTGFVEGFITPRGLDLVPAVVFGVGLAVVFWVLVLWRGRVQPDAG